MKKKLKKSKIIIKKIESAAQDSLYCALYGTCPDDPLPESPPLAWFSPGPNVPCDEYCCIM